jgi:hypothetical protein
MVATISAAADQYHHSVNTLKYADRAKEIKTHVVQNVGSVERHITDYQNIIDNLQVGHSTSLVPIILQGPTMQGPTGCTRPDSNAPAGSRLQQPPSLHWCGAWCGQLNEQWYAAVWVCQLLAAAGTT